MSERPHGNKTRDLKDFMMEQWGGTRSESGGDAGLSAAQQNLSREVEAVLLERVRRRFADTLRTMQVHRRTKPPPPISLADLESNPMSARSSLPLDDLLAQEEAQEKEERDDAKQHEKLPFLANRVEDRHIKQRLLTDVGRTQHQLTAQRNASLRDRRPSTFSGPLAIKGLEKASGSEMFPRPPNTARPPPASAPSGDTGSSSLVQVDGIFSMTATNRTMSMSGSRRLSQNQKRDPREFRKTHKDTSEHSLHYRIPMRPTKEAVYVPIRATHACDDMEYFLAKMKHSTHEFHIKSQNELARVRKAQTTFHRKKKNTLDAMLGDPSLNQLPGPKLLDLVRAKMQEAATQKDHSERLNVFFDHLNDLRGSTEDSLLDRDVIEAYFTDIEHLVREMDGALTMAAFVAVTDKHFPVEQLMRTDVVTVLMLVSPMFGITEAGFDSWVRQRRQQFDGRDYNRVFRDVETMYGGHLQSDVKFNLTVISCRGLTYSETMNIRPVFYVTIECEKKRYTTSTQYSTKPRWNESFLIHLATDASPVAVSLCIGDSVVGAGELTLQRFMPGKAYQVWIPVPGPQIKTAQIYLGVDVFEEVRMSAY